MATKEMYKYASIAVISIGVISTILAMLAFAGIIPQANSEALLGITGSCVFIWFIFLD